MIILPTTPPVALGDQNSVNQSLQHQFQNAKQSKKATDTVQLSAQAQEMAGGGLTNQHNTPAAIRQAADNEAAETVADNKVAEAQRPTNPVTQKPESTKIDILI